MSHFSDPEEPRLDPALASLTAGSRVGGGRFTLLRLLGRGGMGVVWLARDEQLRDSVALKFLPPEIRHDAVALDDLRRETSRSRKLTHPHIIRIHDLFKTDAEAFLSMEYVDGLNLSELRLQQPDRVLQWSFLEPLIKELCQALDYAHGERIVHRDLKPANMIVDGRGRLKLADFGIAAVVTDSVSRVSMGRHTLSGTACYMSPQQLDGKPPQVTDDIYSLGATLYELLTSRAPFFTGDIGHQVRSFAPQPLEKRLAQLNLHNPIAPSVSATIMACLAKEPERRPQTAKGLAEQMGLGSLKANPSKPPEAPAPKREVVPELSLPSPRAESPAAAVGRQPVSRSRWAVGLAAAAIILLSLTTGVLLLSHRSGNRSGAQAAAPEFMQLFNGRDFSGWDGDPQVWFVKDGMITATNGTSKERRPIALFWRDGLVDNFELRLSFRIRSGNSGIYYRANQLLGYEVGGYQFEISGGSTGNLIETGPDRPRREPSRRGSVTVAQFTNSKDKVTVERGTTSTPQEIRDAFRPGGWNDVVIIARDNHITHELNGHAIIETTDEYEKHPRNGTIALEVYGSVPTSVQFRDIRLKRLGSDGHPGGTGKH